MEDEAAPPATSPAEGADASDAAQQPELEKAPRLKGTVKWFNATKASRAAAARGGRSPCSILICPLGGPAWQSGVGFGAIAPRVTSYARGRGPPAHRASASSLPLATTRRRPRRTCSCTRWMQGPAGDGQAGCRAGDLPRRAGGPQQAPRTGSRFPEPRPGGPLYWRRSFHWSHPSQKHLSPRPLPTPPRPRRRASRSRAFAACGRGRRWSTMWRRDRTAVQRPSTSRDRRDPRRWCDAQSPGAAARSAARAHAASSAAGAAAAVDGTANGCRAGRS